MLISGIGQRASTWSRWLDDLAARGVPTAVAEVAPAGFAPRRAYLDAIEGARHAVLDSAGLAPGTPVAIVGFSAGGVGAVDYLARNPHLVDRVVTVSSPLAGNEIATGARTVLGPLAPGWVRDLSTARAVAPSLAPDLKARVTSIVGGAFDGIVTRRSGTVDGIRTLQAARTAFHPSMQTTNDVVRGAALGALGLG